MRFNLVLSHSFCHAQILYISDHLYTGEIYESNRLHLNPHQFSRLKRSSSLTCYRCTGEKLK